MVRKKHIWSDNKRLWLFFMIIESNLRKKWYPSVRQSYNQEFNVATAWSKCKKSFCVDCRGDWQSSMKRWLPWPEEAKSTWKGNCLCQGGGVDNWHGEDWESAFHCPNKLSIANMDPEGWGALRTMQPHYLRAKHGVTTSMSDKHYTIVSRIVLNLISTAELVSSICVING